MPKSIDNVITKAIEKKIGNKVWRLLKKQIEKDVYGYKPSGYWVWNTPYDSEGSGYQRRGSRGLLNNADRYIDVEHVPNTNLWTLRVSTTAQPSQPVLRNYDWTPTVGGLLALLEKADRGFWSRSVGYARSYPRYALTNAQEEAKKNQKEYEAELYKAINKALS